MQIQKTCIYEVVLKDFVRRGICENQFPAEEEKWRPLDED